MVRRIVEFTCLFAAFASIANAQATYGTGMCLTGLTPWVSSCAAGMKGDGYTTNSAYATTSPNAVQLSGSPNPNFSSASVGQLIWVYGAGLATPNGGGTPSFTSGVGTLANGTTLCAQVSYVTINTANFMTSESAPSTESCSTSSGGTNYSINVSAASGSNSTHNGVSANAYAVYVGPSGQETLQNPSVQVKITQVSGGSSKQNYTLTFAPGYNNPLYVGELVSTNPFPSGACSMYTLSGATITAVTATSFTVMGSQTASCSVSVLATASSCATGATPMNTYYCPIGDSFEAGNYNITGQIPLPTSSSVNGTGYFLSTIASIVGTTQANLFDTIPWASGSSGSPVHAVWGTDNKTAEANLIPICQALTASNNNTGGCDILVDPPGSPGSPTGLYLSSATWAIPTGPNNGMQGNILIRGRGSQKIQNGGAYSSGLGVTNDRPSVALAMLGRDYVITVGTPNTLSQGFSAINIGLADPTASSASQGTSPGGFHLQAVAGVHIMNSAGYEFSGGAGIHTDGIATSTQSVEIDSWDCLACYYSEALLPGSVDIKIEGGESSGVGVTTTPPTSILPQGSIGILEEYANTVRVHLTDLQNFSTAGIYCYNSKNCISDSTRHEQVGQSGVTGSSAIVVDGTNSNCLGFVVDKPQIASGFQYAVTVNSSCANGSVRGNFNSAPLHILNNTSTTNTVVEGYDSNITSQVTSVQLGGDLGGTAVAPTVTGISHVASGVLGVANGGTGLSSGTSGGILGFTGSTTLASSALLAAGQFVLGGGAGATPTTSFSVVPITNGGTGQTTATSAFDALSPLTTEGDILTVNAGGLNARVGLGPNGQCVSSNGTDVVWAGCGTVGSQDQTDIASSIASTTVFSVPAGGAGRYVVNLSLTITTSDASGAAVTGVVSWTNETVVRSKSQAAVGFNSTANSIELATPIYADSSSNITYSTSVSGTPSGGKYSVHVWVVRQ